MRFPHILSTLILTTTPSLACDCSHNADPGLWVDTSPPASRVNQLILQSGGNYVATSQGKMVVAMFPDTPELRSCLGNYATAQQDRKGNYLWTAVRCQVGGAVGAVSIVA